MDGKARDYWSRKGIDACYTCRKPLEAGAWVLVTRAVNPKVRHLSCALKVRVCDSSDLPKAAAFALAGDMVHRSAKQ